MNTALRDTYDRIAEDWHRAHGFDEWWVKGADTFLALLPAHGSILDVGCGSGTPAAYLARHGFEVLGVDFSEKLLAIAKREVPQAAFRQLAIEDLDTIEREFDGVFAQASLLHMEKARAGDTVRTMARRAKKGGHLYLAVKEEKPGRPVEEIKREDGYGYPFERFFSYFTMAELESYLREAGLDVVWQDRNPVGRAVWLQIIGQK